MLIITHNNPDPDAIAAAWGLKWLLASIGVSSRASYSGIISRPENRMMVQLLGIEMSKFPNLIIDAYPMIALVDTQPCTGNNCLPDAKLPDVVIDHHNRRDCSNHVLYADVLMEVGSTSTVITHFIMASGGKITKKLATALYYGIKTDTQNLSRGNSEPDFAAAKFLFPMVLTKTLAKIEHPKISRPYIKEFINSLSNAVVCGDVAIVDAGKLTSPDILAQIVDILISLENVKWALAIGELESQFIFSIRTDYQGRNAGRVAQAIAKGIGTGGGHDMTAGGQIPLKDNVIILKENLVCRFIDKLNVDCTKVEGIFN